MHWNLINQNYNAHDYYDILYEGVAYNESTNMSLAHSACDDIEVRAYHDPWEDYYQQLELQHNETTSVSNNWQQQTVDNELDGNYRQPSSVANIENLTNSNLHTLTTARHNNNNNNNKLNSCEIVHNQTDENYSNKIVHNSSIIEITTRLQNQQKEEEKEEEQEVAFEEADIDQEVNNVHMNEEQAHVAKVIQVQVVANEHCIGAEVYHCPKATNCTNITATTTTTTETETITRTMLTNCDDETIERDINKDTYYIENCLKTQQILQDGLEEQNNTQYVVEEVKGISYWCRHLGIFCISLIFCWAYV